VTWPRGHRGATGGSARLLQDRREIKIFLAYEADEESEKVSPDQE
jgi:hypothetical protein